MQINIVGLGNLGSAMAVIAANNGHQVLGWEYDENVVNSINIFIILPSENLMKIGRAHV